MKMLRKIVLLGGIFASASGSAAVEFANGLIPVELARALNGGNYYRTLPDDFPVPPLPASLELEVIGSIEWGSQQQVLVRNSAPGDTVRAALQAAYASQGWLTLMNYPGALVLCHDQHGTLQISSDDSIAGALRTKVARIQYPLSYPLEQSCADQLENIQSGGTSGITGFFQKLLPVLEVPDSAVSNPLPGLGIRALSTSLAGANAEVTQEGSIQLADFSAAQLQQYFAPQLQEQGWLQDSAATGVRSASSVWFKMAQALPVAGQTSEEQEYTLVMTLLNATEDTWRVSLKLQTGNGSATGSFGVGSITDSGYVRDPF